MATSQAAFKVEQAIGHDDNAVIQQDVSNPAIDRSKYADPSGETMKALVWLGKGHVEVRKFAQLLLSVRIDVVLALSFRDIFGLQHHYFRQILTDFYML
jgi:hypothetical protein